MRQSLSGFVAVFLALSPAAQALPGASAGTPSLFNTFEEQALSSIKPFYSAAMGSSGTRHAGHWEAQTAKSLTNLTPGEHTDAMQQVWNQMVEQFFPNNPAKTTADLQALLENDKDSEKWARRMALR